MKKNLMGTYLENVFAMMAIMMMAQIIYASHAIIVGKKKWIYYKLILALHVKILILINALNAMLRICVKKNLMKIYMVNVFVVMIIMILEINYVNSVLVFGN